MAAFDLAIESLNNRRYRLTVIDSPAGTASIEISPPFTFDELAELSDTFGGRAGLSPEDLETQQEQFGTTLFSAIFTDAIGYAYSASQKATGDAPLHIRLKLDKAGELAALPWHLLNDPDDQPITIARLDKPQNFAPVGGLRENLRYGVGIPRLIGAGVGVAALVAVIFAAVLRPPADVDLIVTGVRFLPPRPAPGEIFTITMTITNQGKSRSGAFDWAWFRGDSRGVRPDLTGQVDNLDPGDTITVRGEYSFGWWERYDSTGAVDPTGKTSDKDIFNNTTKPGFAIVQTSNEDFVIDFTILPPADLITAARDLNGTEFDLWSMTPKVDRNINPDCGAAIVKIVVIENENFVRSGLPGAATGCDSLPLEFTLDQPIGAAQIDFLAQQAGGYTLSLIDANGTVIDKVTTSVAAGRHSISLPINNRVLKRSSGVFTARFEGLPGMHVQKLSLTQASTD
jgi:hypothetical protein